MAIKTIVGWDGRRNWDSQVSPHKRPITDLGRMQTHSLLATALGSSGKGSSGIQGETEVSGIRASARE